jgi:two-component system, LytTR family, sensor kinase
MARSFSQLYLRCQLIGWSSVLVWLIGMSHIVGNQPFGKVIWFQLIFCLTGLLTTHLLRNFIRRRHYRELPIRKALPRLLLATVTAAVIGSVLEFAAIRSSMTITHPPRWLTHQNIFAGTFQYLTFFITWTFIYCLHFYIVLRRKLNLEDRQLQLLLKEKELLAAEPPVDVGFITGSLDRIRSLIDVDPDGARAGINTFSHMLRKGRLKTD